MLLKLRNSPELWRCEGSRRGEVGRENFGAEKGAEKSLGRGRGCVFGSSSKQLEWPCPELVHLWLLVHSNPFNPGSNFFIYSKAHLVSLHGFFKTRTSDPILNLVLQKKFLIGFSFTYLHT